MPDFKLSEKSLGRLANVHIDLQRIAKRAIEITKVDFGIPPDGGKRTAARQNELYRAGKSQADGFTRKSKHQSGDAIDFFAYVDGKASWEQEHLAMVACAFFQAAIELDVRIRWGGLWRNFNDSPHIERYE